MRQGPLLAGQSLQTASLERAPPKDGYLGQEVGNFSEQVWGVSTSVVTVGASLAFWVIYTVVFALIVVVGGFVSRKIGPKRAQTATVV